VTASKIATSRASAEQQQPSASVGPTASRDAGELDDEALSAVVGERLYSNTCTGSHIQSAVITAPTKPGT
jgi:hypothetical protein